MPYGCIYEIVNTVTGKAYIGQTIKPIKVRWSAHKSAAKGAGKSNALHNAIRKYGPDAFTVELVTTAESKDELDTLERVYIEGLNTMNPNGYNLKEGGANGKYSEDVLLKMSKALKGKKAWNKGTKGLNKLDLTADQRQAIGDRFRNKPSKRRKAIQDSTGRVFNSASEASAILGICRTSITAVCTGRAETAGGLSFQYHHQES